LSLIGDAVDYFRRGTGQVGQVDSDVPLIAA